MAARLTFEYDRQGDPRTGEVESLEILAFSSRLRDEPFAADARSAR